MVQGEKWPIISNQDCVELLKEYFIDDSAENLINEKKICVRRKRNIDQGSPLLVDYQDDRWTVVGFVSRRIRSKGGKIIGEISTRVDKYLPWITENL